MSDLNEAAVAAWLEANVAGFRGPLTATKFKGGQSNPTYKIDAASGCYVLRRKPSGKLLASAHAIDREYRVLKALHGGNVPVARPIAYCSDVAVAGSEFYVMDFVPGRISFDPALPELETLQRAAVYDEVIRVMAAIHAVDPGASGLADYGKPGNYFERQIARWTEQYRAAQTRPIAAMDTLIDWLPAHCPPDDGSIALVHGDFRIDNLIFEQTKPRVLAVVDWELSTLGHPLSDLAYFCMALRLPRNPVIPGLAGRDRAALGIPGEESIVAAYAQRSGRDPGARWPFYLAFNFFRLAAIAQGVAKRAEQGNASSEQAAAVGAMASHVAELGAALT